MNQTVDEIFKQNKEEFKSSQLTFDIDWIYETTLIEEYKEKLSQLGNMLEDIPFKLPKLRELEKNFLKDVSEQHPNDITLMINSGLKGNAEAFWRIFVADGYKIDPDSKIIGFIHNSLMEGYDTYEDNYIAAVHSRISGIINADSVERVGYLYRKLSFLFRFLKFGETNNCEAKMKIEINDSNKFLFYGRLTSENLYINENTPNGTYYIYSPLYCKSKDPEGVYNTVCEKCFGKLSVNYAKYERLNTIFSIITERLMQILLSAKHLLSVKLISYEGINYLGNNIWEYPNEIYSIREGKLFKDEDELPFMAKNLVDEGDGKFSSDGVFYSAALKSLLPYTEKLFNKTGENAEVEDIVEYYEKFMAFNTEIIKLNKESLFFELILMLMTRVEDDYSKLWKDNQDSNYTILSPHNVIMRQRHLDSIFYERFEQQISSKEFHDKPLNWKGGLWEFYIGDNKFGQE